MDWQALTKHVAKLESVTTQGARDNFDIYGELKPVAIVLVTRDPKGARVEPTPVIVPLDLSSEEAKDTASHMLHRLTEVSAAIAIAIVTEIWYARYEGATREDLPFLPRPATLPTSKREEYVIVQIESQIGAKMLMAKITRCLDGSGVLGPWVEEPSSFGGRMTGFIKLPSAGEA